jgi:F0F1-type ATP synthase membrane subunit b/b'
MPIRSIGYDLGREDARKEIRAAQAKALRELRDMASRTLPSQAEKEMDDAIRVIESSTRAPRRATKKKGTP